MSYRGSGFKFQLHHHLLCALGQIPNLLKASVSSTVRWEYSTESHRAVLRIIVHVKKSLGK